MTNLPTVLSIDSDRSQYIVSDYEKSRATLHELIDNGKEMLSLAMEVARSTEHPKAIEAAAILLKTVSDSNDKLMRLNHSYKDYFKRDDRHRHIVDEPIPTAQTTQVTNNYLFSGTVSDLQKKLSDMKDADVSIIDITPKS